MIRRLFDIFGGACALLFAAPLMAAAMVAIRLESRGHPIYKQRRIGRHGKPFDMFKLRTMVDGAEHIGAGLAINENDSRVTRVGAFLRRTSLDELPNLVNVIRGDMSFIGPRPTIPAPSRPIHAAPTRPFGDPPGDHRLGPGQRARRLALERADRVGPPLHRTPLLGLRPAYPRPHFGDRARRLRPLQGPDRRLGRTGRWMSVIHAGRVPNQAPTMDRRTRAPTTGRIRPRSC